MGWCSGTPIFDSTADVVVKAKIPLSVKKDILKTLISEMENQDWDCQGDSDYWNHKWVGPLLGHNPKDDED